MHFTHPACGGEYCLDVKEFLNMDCMRGMRDTPDNFFDLAIVDPPYGVSLTGGRGNNGWTSKEHWAKAQHGWNEEVPSSDYFNELFRVSKNQIIWGGNYFNLPPTKCILIWDKKQRDFSLADAELAWASFDKSIRIFDYSRAAALSDNKSNGGKIHPTQKPIRLYKWILKNYAQTHFKILSTHVGSASDLIAFEDFGCDYVGYEIDKDYFETASKRLEQHKAQLRLEL